MFRNFNLGISSYGEAHKFIKKHNLWGYVLLPGLMNVLLIVLIILFGFDLMDRFAEWFYNWLGLNTEHTGIVRILLAAVKFILSFLLKIALFFFYIASYKYIIFAMMSPFLAILSEKVEEKLAGTTYPFNLKQYIKDIIRGLRINFRNMFVEFFWIFLMLIASFIPLVGLITPFILFYISSYFYGFGFIDYSLERYKFSVAQSVQFVRQNKGFAFANGFMFYVIFLIPILGLLVAPAYSCVAAAIATEKIKAVKNNTIINAIK